MDHASAHEKMRSLQRRGFTDLEVLQSSPYRDRDWDVYDSFGQLWCEAPICGHSACRQNWIDTGNGDCAKGGA